MLIAANKIEESFRVTKTDIEARPIYVRLDNHIESHFLSCFVSLVMIRLIQKKLNNQYSAAVIQEALNSCEVFEIGQGYCKLFANENMQKINEAYNISITNQIEKKENIKKFFK